VGKFSLFSEAGRRDPVEERMRKKSFYVFITAAILAVFSVTAGLAQDLSIESVTVTRPNASECTYSWQAEIKNNSSNGIDGTKMPVQAYQGSTGGSWSPAGGSSLGNIGSGQKVARGVTFNRKANSNQIKVQIFSQGSVLAEKIVNLGAESAASVSIENCTLTDTGYKVTIRNLGSVGIPDSIVQGYAAISSSPNTWKGAGGMTVECIKGSGSYQHSGPKPSGYDMIKIQVKRGGNVIAEKIFNFAPPTSGSGPQRPATPKTDLRKVTPTPKPKAIN
jgi:hypothetical protein